MIFVYGYDKYYAGEGQSDLIALVNNVGGANTDAQGNLAPDVLARALQCVENTRYGYVHVMHFRPDGAPGLVEYWSSRHAAPETLLKANEVRVDDAWVYQRLSTSEFVPEVPLLE